MADDCLALEGELQEQLEAQREALTGVEEAIRELGGDDVASAAGAEELLQVRLDVEPESLECAWPKAPGAARGLSYRTLEINVGKLLTC